MEPVALAALFCVAAVATVTVLFLRRIVPGHLLHNPHRRAVVS